MLKRILTATVCGLVLTVALPQAGLAQGNGKGKGHNKQADRDDDNRDRDSDRGDKRGVRIVFSVRDRETIRGYYQDRNSSLPPGLAKRDGNLPPGLQKRVQPFPEDLERRLPPLPDTYRRVTLGVDILILDRRTQRIVDVIHDILRP